MVKTRKQKHFVVFLRFGYQKLKQIPKRLKFTAQRNSKFIFYNKYNSNRKQWKHFYSLNKFSF